MKIGILGLSGHVLTAALCLCFASTEAQTKPPESASKIKKVLVYSKVGGWVNLKGIAEVKAVISTLAAAQGFEVVQLAEDAGITLEYLKQFQVIVWNNNTNGGASVPSATARQAVLDYVDQGGGWMLVCFAGDHANTWTGLAERMGTTFAQHAETNRGEVVMDSAARAHAELKWMVEGFPRVFELYDLWFSFYKTVRPLPGVTVVATSRSIPGVSGNVVLPVADGSGDNVYIWAREVGKGRLLYNAIGYGFFQLMEQQDSIIPRMYWENLRYAAGDYQNGCTTPSSSMFDPSARVHVESMCSTTGLTASPAPSKPILSRGAGMLRLARIPSRSFTLRLRNIQGVEVWARTLPAGTGEIALDGSLKPGLYLFELLDNESAIRQRLLIP